ncbi:MAG: energy transducer TonB [Candidatus Omnitrophica bacterium]|nr:energy transducer TonB [Candidatus Omnitrophota bacterium]
MELSFLGAILESSDVRLGSESKDATGLLSPPEHPDSMWLQSWWPEPFVENRTVDELMRPAQETVPVRAMRVILQPQAGDRIQPRSTGRLPVLAFESAPPQIEGDLAGRALLHKPPPPDLGVWAVETEGHVATRVAMTVLPSGLVTNVDLLESSGHPWVDSTIIHYLRRWRFVSDLASGASSQRGVLTVNLELK